MKNLQDLRNKATEIQSQSELMEGREKGDMAQLLNQYMTVVNYDFADGDNGLYSVLHFKELPELFFFGGGVITDQLKKLDGEGFKDVIQKEGLPVKFESVKSKNNRYYTNAILFPED